MEYRLLIPLVRNCLKLSFVKEKGHKEERKKERNPQWIGWE
jgi:hypothetical protein